MISPRSLQDLSRGIEKDTRSSCQDPEETCCCMLLLLLACWLAGWLCGDPAEILHISLCEDLVEIRVKLSLVEVCESLKRSLLDLVQLILRRSCGDPAQILPKKPAWSCTSPSLACGILPVNSCIKWLFWHVFVHFDCAGLRKLRVAVMGSIWSGAFSCKFSDKVALVTCPCAFWLRIAQNWRVGHPQLSGKSIHSLPFISMNEHELIPVDGWWPWAIPTQVIHHLHQLCYNK